MKYLKSFLGTLIVSLFVILMIMPVIGVVLLSEIISPWLLFGEIIVFPITILLIVKFVSSDKNGWLFRLIFSAFNE